MDNTNIIASERHFRHLISHLLAMAQQAEEADRRLIS